MDQVIAGFSVIAIVAGLVELIKSAGIPSRIAPLFSIAFGIGLSALGNGSFSVNSVVSGIVVGLAASGAWSGTKAVFGN